jgi:hypothetical protein
MGKAAVLVRESTREGMHEVAWESRDVLPVGRIWVGRCRDAPRPQFLYRLSARGPWRLSAGCWRGLLSSAERRIRRYHADGFLTHYRDAKLRILAALKAKAASLDRAAAKGKGPARKPSAAAAKRRRA